MYSIDDRTIGSVTVEDHDIREPAILVGFYQARSHVRGQISGSEFYFTSLQTTKRTRAESCESSSRTHTSVREQSLRKQQRRLSAHVHRDRSDRRHQAFSLQVRL